MLRTATQSMDTSPWPEYIAINYTSNVWTDTRGQAEMNSVVFIP